MEVDRSMIKLVGAVALAGFSWACRGPTTEPEQVSLTAPPLVAVERVGERVETMADTLGLFQPNDLLSHPDGFLVVDTGNDRLVVFDRQLGILATIGSSGAGPGELEVPMFAEATADGFGVYEMSNARVSFFQRDGTFTGTVPLRGMIGDMALGEGGTIFVADAAPGAYLKRIDPDGGRADIGILTPEAGAGRVSRQDLVAATSEGGVLVLDNSIGRLVRFDADGALVKSADLPAPILESLRAGRAGVVGGFAKKGVRVLSPTLAKSLATQPDGRVLVLFTAHPYFGLLLDPETLSGRLLSVPEEEGVWQPLLHAYAAVLEGDTITVLHEFGLTRFRLAPAS